MAREYLAPYLSFYWDPGTIFLSSWCKVPLKSGSEHALQLEKRLPELKGAEKWAGLIMNGCLVSGEACCDMCRMHHTLRQIPSSVQLLRWHKTNAIAGVFSAFWRQEQNHGASG